jgi:choline dehydrogenase-like flavoprotein
MEPQTPHAATRDAMAGWWPSRYGAGDEAGALNEITPGKVLDAIRLVRQGRVYDLAHVLHQDIPAFPGRTFRQYLTTNYHDINRRRADAGPAGLGRTSVNWIVEQLTATQQMGTHIDGLNHLQAGDRTYNGFRLADIVEDHGTNRLGIDTLPQVVTRGLLLDVAAARGAERLPAGEVVTVADAEAALAAAGHDVRPGDAVLFHTGWGSLWGTDNERYAAGEPGPGLALAGWLADHRVALTGCDTWSFGPYPPERPDAPFAVPQLLNVRHGVVVVENLRLAVAHQNGTVRFGTDPATSALDLNCKMHDLDNLYVVDSSFFVSSTAVNPTLTIIANALRVADHIVGRLGATGQRQARPEPVTAHA